MLRTTLAALTLCATLATPAQAVLHPELLPRGKQLTDTRTMESLRIARAFWHVPVQSPTARVYAAEPEQLDVALGVDSVGIGGLANGGDIWMIGATFRTYIFDIEWCTRIAHEYGHKLGSGHSQDKRSIMHTPRSQRAAVYGCYKQFLPKGKGREWRYQNGGKPLWLSPTTGTES